MNALTGKPTVIPEGIEPTEWRRALELRIGLLFDRADRLIAALDAADGDSDLEDGAEAELPLGWANTGPQTHLHASDEREGGGETDPPGLIAGGNEEGAKSHPYGPATTGPALFDGSGNVTAADALRNAGPRVEHLPVRTIGERARTVNTGEVLRTAVPYHSGYVRPSGALPDDDGPEMTDFRRYVRGI